MRSRSGLGSPRPLSGLGLRAAIRNRLLVAVVLVALVGLLTGLVLAPDAPHPRPACPDHPGVGAPPAVAGPAAAERVSRSRAGAVTAAAGHATLLARMFGLDAGHAQQVAAEAVSDAYRPTLLAAVQGEVVALQRQAAALPGDTVYRQAVLATRLDSYTEEPSTAAAEAGAPGGRARVSVWMLLTLAATGSPAAGQPGGVNPVARFSTARLDLVWQRGAWRLDGSVERPGPTPLVDGPLYSAAEFEAALAGFSGGRPR